MKTTPEELAKRCAEFLLEEYEIGHSSNFCDDNPEWDHADHDELAAKISESLCLKELLDVAREAYAIYNNHNEPDGASDENYSHCRCGFCKAMTALQQKGIEL